MAGGISAELIASPFGGIQPAGADRQRVSATEEQGAALRHPINDYYPGKKDTH
jgi:hypothetical protein